MKKKCKDCGKNYYGHRNSFYCKDCKKTKNYYKRGEYEKGKIQCQICGKWYIQVCSHVVQKHGIENREYKNMIGTFVKKGLVPEWFRKKKSEITLENKTYENLKAGKKFWFVKGDKRAGDYKRCPEHLEWLSQLGQRNKKSGVKLKRKLV